MAFHSSQDLTSGPRTLDARPAGLRDEEERAATRAPRGSHVSLRPVVRRILLVCATLFLITLAWGTISGGLRQIPRSLSLGQRVETGAQLVCGLLSLLTVITCFWWRRWGPRVRVVWAVSLAATAGFSSLVWGPPDLFVGLAFAAVALLMALAIIRLLR